MRLKTVLFMLLLVSLLAACSLFRPDVPQRIPDTQNSNLLPDETAPDDAGGEIEADDQPAPGLATPVADSPAAGICATFDGQWVTITIYPDIPDPRCSFIRPEQMLEVVNARGETMLVSIAGMQAELAPGESHNFEVPFGDYLMPGVHRVGVQPCCGAELVLSSGE